MSRASDSKPTSQHNRQSQTKPVANDPKLERLGRRFAKFHRDNPSGTRVSDKLRAAVLEAIRHGANPIDVRRSCGLGFAQLKRWQRNPPQRSASKPPAFSPSRVFDLLDESTAPDKASELSTDEQPLELQLGDWSISIRRVDR